MQKNIYFDQNNYLQKVLLKERDLMIKILSDKVYHGLEAKSCNSC